jgi:hypothetical protein
MRPAIILRSWLALGIGLHGKASKVGDQRIYLINLVFPPGYNLRIERIGCLKFPGLDRCAEPGSQKYLYIIWPENFRNRSHLLQVRSCEDQGIGVYIGKDCTVDTYRGVGACVIGIPFRNFRGKRIPFPERPACISSLYATVQVIPVIKNPDFGFR